MLRKRGKGTDPMRNRLGTINKQKAGLTHPHRQCGYELKGWTPGGALRGLSEGNTATDLYHLG